MIEIRPLTQFIPAEFARLMSGYISSERYRVRKEETPTRTLISLELEPLAAPYRKTWPLLEEDIERYQQITTLGFSLAAYDGQRQVAVAIAEPRHWNRTLWIWEFHVAADHRREGIGRRLMEAVADKGRAAQLRVLAVETQNTNVPAIDFYRTAGFEIEGIDLSYYTNSDRIDGEVALFMKRKIE